MPCTAVFLGLLVLQAAPAPAPVAEAARVEELVQRHMAQPGAVALSVAVARGAEMLYEKAHGKADLEFDVPADALTMFRIGSVTKQFTAAALLKLAEEGRVEVDAPLTEYLPEYPTHGHEITLRHLLTHTSGIRNYTDLGERWELVRARELPDEELVALWKDEPLDFEPGTRWSYSNSGYYLLGMVIAKVTGESYAEYLHEAFLEPLHLTRTRYDSNRDVIPNRAQGYAFEENVFLNDGLLGMSQPGAAGALMSTAGDLVRWQQALVSGQAVAPASYEEMTLPFLLNDGSETRYGMGLQLDEQSGHRRVWHGGGIDGFNSVLLYFPDERLHVAVISSSERLRADQLGVALAEELLAAR